jgi:hypothetical protein
MIMNLVRFSEKTVAPELLRSGSKGSQIYTKE